MVTNGFVLRLYPFFDVDLLKLKNTPGVKFSTLCKDVLRAYVSGQGLKLPVSDIDLNTDGTGLIGEKKYADIYIRFNPVKDKELIDLLNNIVPGYKRQFIKNLLRVYIGKINLSGYFKTGVKAPLNYATIHIYNSPQASNEEISSNFSKKSKKQYEKRLDTKSVSSNTLKENVVDTINTEEKTNTIEVMETDNEINTNISYNNTNYDDFGNDDFMSLSDEY